MTFFAFAFQVIFYQNRKDSACIRFDSNIRVLADMPL